MYLYRLDSGRSGIRVEVGIYDPQRWIKSVERGETTQAGGMSFGESAEVLATSVWSRDEEMVTEVAMGAIGSHDTATAKRRIDVYSQAAQLADFINDSLATGIDIATIAEFLSAFLAQDPNAPATKPFRYGGDGPTTTDEIEEWYA